MGRVGGTEKEEEVLQGNREEGGGLISLSPSQFLGILSQEILLCFLQSCLYGKICGVYEFPKKGENAIVSCDHIRSYLDGIFLKYMYNMHM